MNGPGLLEYNAVLHGVWIVAGVTLAVLGLFWLLDLVADARQSIAHRRAERRDAAASEAEAGGEPPMMPALHRDRALEGGPLRRYTSEGRVNRVPPVRAPRIGS